jgi:hypothetical protein
MMDKVHFKQGDYVEKLSSCRISTLVFISMKHTLRIIIDSPSYPTVILGVAWIAKADIKREIESSHSDDDDK